MTDALAEQFRMVAAELLEKGEDAEEMLYWTDIYPDLPEDKQKELLALFQKELEELQALS